MLNRIFMSLGGAICPLVFAGGIGEKSSRLHGAVMSATGCLRCAIDEREIASVSDRASDVAVEFGTAREGTAKWLLVPHG